MDIGGTNYYQYVCSLAPFGIDDASDGGVFVGPIYKNTTCMGINSLSCDLFVLNCPVDGEIEWTRAQIVDNIRTYGDEDLLWANHDIVRLVDGAIHLSATDPVPVYD